MCRSADLSSFPHQIREGVGYNTAVGHDLGAVLCFLFKQAPPVLGAEHVMKKMPIDGGRVSHARAAPPRLATAFGYLNDVQ